MTARGILEVQPGKGKQGISRRGLLLGGAAASLAFGLSGCTGDDVVQKARDSRNNSSGERGIDAKKETYEISPRDYAKGIGPFMASFLARHGSAPMVLNDPAAYFKMLNAPAEKTREGYDLVKFDPSWYDGQLGPNLVVLANFIHANQGRLPESDAEILLRAAAQHVIQNVYPEPKPPEGKYAESIRKDMLMRVLQDLSEDMPRDAFVTTIRFGRAAKHEQYLDRSGCHVDIDVKLPSGKTRMYKRVHISEAIPQPSAKLNDTFQEFDPEVLKTDKPHVEIGFVFNSSGRVSPVSRNRSRR